MSEPPRRPGTSRASVFAHIGAFCRFAKIGALSGVHKSVVLILEHKLDKIPRDKGVGCRSGEPDEASLLPRDRCYEVALLPIRQHPARAEEYSITSSSSNPFV